MRPSPGFASLDAGAIIQNQRRAEAGHETKGGELDERERLSRRAFLLGATRAGTASALALTFGGPAGAAAATMASARTGAVRAEPPEPPRFTRYVSRPDLRPIGVSVRSAPGPLGLGAQPLYIFCAPKAAQQPFPRGATPGLMILDTAGELVWFKPLPSADDRPFDFKVQSYEGRATLTWFQGHSGAGHGVSGHYVLADSSYRQVGQVLATNFPCDLHEFILTPQGTALHTAYEDSSAVRFKGTPVLIGHVQEVDVATNRLLFDWSSYPAVGFGDSYVGPEAAFFDYFHVNSIDRWPGPGRNLLISARNTCAIYLVNQETKRIVWQLGGKRSSFRLGSGSRFWYQHDARALPDGSGVSLFDDASDPAPEAYAAGKILELNQRDRNATLRHLCAHTDGLLRAANQGSFEPLPGGGHVVGWGSEPFFSIYPPSVAGELGAHLVLDGRFPTGAQSYRVFAFPWRGDPPQSELALAVRHEGASGARTAYVSWNGATDVAHWRLSGGPSATALRSVRTARRTGFETAIRLPAGAGSYIQAAALDAHGRVLGHTRTVTAR